MGAMKEQKPEEKNSLTNRGFKVLLCRRDTTDVLSLRARSYGIAAELTKLLPSVYEH